MTSKVNPIGFFDSGVGGLSILSEVQKILPNEQLIYFADSKYAPYGDKDTHFILERCLKIVDFFLTLNVKAILIASNTVTAIAIEEVRKLYPNIPIIGVEPGIKSAIKISKNKNIGILITSNTFKSRRFKRLVNNYTYDLKVISIPCPGLVELVEQNQFSGSRVSDLLSLYLAPLKKEECDTVILGCTHYSFLSYAINKELNNKMKIIETSKPVALNLKNILKHNGIINDINSQTGITFFSSEKISQNYKNIVNVAGKNNEFLYVSI